MSRGSELLQRVAAESAARTGAQPIVEIPASGAGARTKLDAFMAVYEEELRRAVTEHPEDYGFPVENVPTVAGRMRAAFERGSYNKDGRAVKATCKRLGINYTYAAINQAVAP